MFKCLSAGSDEKFFFADQKYKSGSSKVSCNGQLISVLIRHVKKIILAHLNISSSRHALEVVDEWIRGNIDVFEKNFMKVFL